MIPKLGRRGFLRALGLAPAAIAVETAGIGLGGRAVLGYSSIASAVWENTGGPMNSPTNCTEIGGISHAQKLAAYLATHDLPQYLVDRMRAQSRQSINRFDPDLAANRSFSLSTKMRVQADRDFDRAVLSTREVANRNVLSELFSKATGFGLW
jgi:hypothetical protein